MFGLFESETITSVSTSFNRVIEDRLLPNSIRTGTIKGILVDDGQQLVENIMEDIISSIGVKAERMYRYGKTSYPLGAPTSRIYKSTSLDAILNSVLQVVRSSPITLEYVKYAPLNRQHYGWQTLYDSYGYIPLTNELTSLSTLKGVPVYLEDMQLIVAQANMTVYSGTAFDQWGASATSGYTPLRSYSLGNSRQHTPIGVDDVTSVDYLKVTAVWKIGEVVHHETFNIPFPISEITSDYVQAKYTYQVESYRTYDWDPRGVSHGKVETIHYNYFVEYFTYQIGLGTYPELDGVFTNEHDDLGSFFPFGYFRYDKTPTSTDKTSAEYKAQAKLMKYLNMDYAKVNEAVNASPEINDVQSAMLMMIVPAASSDALECRYLFDFFRSIYAKSGLIAVPDAPYDPTNAPLMRIQRVLAKGKLIDPRMTYIIKDARFTTTMGMTGIYRRLVPGVIGKIGTYSSSKGEVVKEHSGVTYGHPDYDGNREEFTITWNTEEPVHYYCKQLTEHIYEEIQVHNLRVTYNVYGEHATTNFMIPLDHSITEQYTLPDREHLYARSLHYVFNAKKETTLKWYQQEWFSTVLIIVAVAWTRISMGSDGGSGLAAAIAAGTVATIEYIIIYCIIVPLIVQAIAKMFVKLLGPEFAILVAVVAAAYGMHESFNAVGGVAGAPWAQDLLTLSNSLISEVGKSVAQSLEGLKNEADQFNLFAKSKMDALEKVKEEMEGSRLISPFVLFGESPTDYFNRTVHSGNIGIISVDAISNYCAISLKLPTLEQTISD